MWKNSLSGLRSATIEDSSNGSPLAIILKNVVRGGVLMLRPIGVAAICLAVPTLVSAQIVERHIGESAGIVEQHVGEPNPAIKIGAQAANQAHTVVRHVNELDEPDAAPVQQQPGVVLTLKPNQGRTYAAAQPFSKAIPGNPKIVDLLPITDAKVFIQPLTAGVTNLTLFSAKGDVVDVVTIVVEREAAPAAPPAVPTINGDGRVNTRIHNQLKVGNFDAWRCGPGAEPWKQGNLEQPIFVDCEIAGVNWARCYSEHMQQSPREVHIRTTAEYDAQDKRIVALGGCEPVEVAKTPQRQIIENHVINETPDANRIPARAASGRVDQ